MKTGIIVVSPLSLENVCDDGLTLLGLMALYGLANEWLMRTKGTPVVCSSLS